MQVGASAKVACPARVGARISAKAAICPLIATSGRPDADPVALHQEVGWNPPARIDLLNHVEGQPPAPRQDLGCARARAKNLGELGLCVAELGPNRRRLLNGQRRSS